MIEVIAEHGAQALWAARTSYYIHENLVRAHISLDRTQRAQFVRGDSQKRLLIPAVEREVFDTFAQWIYTQRLDIKEIEDAEAGRPIARDEEMDWDTSDSSDSSTDGDDPRNWETPPPAGPRTRQCQRRDSRIYNRLAKLYIFARHRATEPFQTAVFMRLAQFLAMRTSNGANGEAPILAVVCKVVDAVGMDNSFCQALARAWGDVGRLERLRRQELARMPPAFLADVI